jgi:hypothetical protein
MKGLSVDRVDRHLWAVEQGGFIECPTFKMTAGRPGRRVRICVPQSGQKSRVLGRSMSLRVNCFGTPSV